MGKATIFTAFSLVLLTVSMVFLILGMVSLPVTTSLKLAATGNYTYGIFGYCNGTSCSAALYPVSFGDIDKHSGWFLAESTRNTLAKTFIAAPIAAGLSFLAVIFTLVSLCTENSVIKIFSLLFGVISFAGTALVAVMVVLVFYPNTAWTGWLYVAAAGVSLLAIPCLLLSVKIKGGNVESDVESEKNFDSYGKNSFSSNPLLAANESRFQFNGPPANNYPADDVSSFSKDYSFRGGTGTTFSTTNKNDSNASLFEAKPHVANDITQPNNVPSNSNRDNASLYEDAVNLNQGPSTPISSKQKMAPNFIPNVAIPSNDSGYKPVSSLPYPKSERSSVNYTRNGYNKATLGVFDHHPNVEGHQPFMELGNDVAEPSLPTGQIVSDGDSDFTSVSQRPPNEMYQSPQQQKPPQLYQQLYQQLYPNVSNYQPQFQQGPPMSSSFYGSEGAYNPQYQNSGYQQQPMQSSGYQQQNYGQGSPRVQKGPTVSDSVLNNNPDFSIGGGQQRRKQFIPPSKRYGNPTRPQQRPNASLRDGPYGVV